YFSYSFNFAYQSQYETYTNPPFGIADHYLNRIYSFVWKSRLEINHAAELYGGVDYSKNLLFSNENALNNSDTIISRESYAAYLAAKYRFLDNFDATVSLRTELQSDLNAPETLPGISLHYEEPHSGLILQASWGKIYHAPTFNELYWKAAGNPNLLPEHGTSTEGSIILPIEMARMAQLSLQISGFFTSIED